MKDLKRIYKKGEWVNFETTDNGVVRYNLREKAIYGYRGAKISYNYGIEILYNLCKPVECNIDKYDLESCLYGMVILVVCNNYYKYSNNKFMSEVLLDINMGISSVYTILAQAPQYKYFYQSLQPNENNYFWIEFTELINSIQYVDKGYSSEVKDLYFNYVVSELKTISTDNDNNKNYKIINDILIYDLREGGYISFLKYLFKIKKNNISEANYKKMSVFLNGTVDSWSYAFLIAKLCLENFELLTKIAKIIHNDFHNYVYFCDCSMKELINLCINEKNNPYIINHLNDNRGIEVNLAIIKNLIEKYQHEMISHQLQLLNQVNNYTIDFKGEKYIVKVPQNIEDLLNEGKQQNNCVGYYYNESIAKGDDLIYFVRKFENPEKSYLTCRYNKAHSQTVEYRTKNNGYYKYNELLQIIDCKLKEIII